LGYNPRPDMKQALEMRTRYKDDLKAGHKDAAEYWRGQASAYFTGNPHYLGPAVGNMYYCLRCQSYHNRKSKIGKSHKQFSWPDERHLIDHKNPVLATLGNAVISGMGLVAGVGATKWISKSLKNNPTKKIFGFVVNHKTRIVKYIIYTSANNWIIESSTARTKRLAVTRRASLGWILTEYLNCDPDRYELVREND